MISSRTRSFPVFAVLTSFLGLVLLFDAFYCAPSTSIDKLPVISSLMLPVATSIIPLTWRYLRQLERPGRERITDYLWVFIPVIMFTGGLFINGIARKGALEGFLDTFYSTGPFIDLNIQSRSVMTFFVWDIIVFRSVLAIQAVILLIHLIRVFRKRGYHLSHIVDFFLHGASIRPEELQSFNISLFFFVLPFKVFSFRGFMVSHHWIAIVMSLLLLLDVTLFCFTALFGAAKEITLHDMLSAWRYNYNEKNKGEVVEALMAALVEDAEAEALRRIKDRIGDNLDVDSIAKGEEEVTDRVASSLFSAVAASWDDNSLLSRFQSLMVNEKLFLKPGLTVTEVADRLNTNKTYISKMVNNTYNLGFPELMNTLRIDYAEEYILSHRGAKQDTIAEACGFLSASSFNNIFKKVTGLTPKMWVATREKHSAR